MAVTAKPEISKILLDLGIEPVDVYAVDNAEKTYMSALVEGINTLEVANQGDSPRSIILRDELKALREKRRRVNVDKLFSRRSVSANRVNPKSLLPAAQEEDSQKQDFGRVNNILDAILKVISLDFKREKNQDRQDDKDEQRQRRINREKNLEKIKKSSLGVAKKLTSSLVKPFEDIIDRITNFLSATVIGYLINKVLSWFSDPNNKRKVEAIGRFVGNFYPALIALGLTLLSPVRFLIRGMVQTLAFAIPKLIALIAANPYAAAAAATLLVGGGLLLNDKLSKNKEVENLSNAQNQSTQKIIGEGEDTGAIGEDTGAIGEDTGAITERTSQSFTTSGGPEAEQLKNLMGESRGEETQEFNKGGKVPGFGNKDTVPAMLTPGEFIMSKGAVQKYGVNMLESMNAAGGGTNKPTFSRGKGKYNEGGGVIRGMDGVRGMDGGEELVYSLKKFTTEKVVKGDEITRTKTREKTQGSIKLEDLYANQDQILSQLPQGTTIESIINGTSGIDAATLYPILQTSDAQAVSNAKERAATLQMMQENNLINSDNTVKGFSYFNQNFKGGGLVNTYQNFKGGGLVSNLFNSISNFNDGDRTGNIRQKGSMILASLVSLATGKGGSPYQEFEDPFKGKKFSPPPKDLPKPGDSPVKKATFIESILKEESTKGVPISPPIVSVNNQTIVLPAIKGRSKPKDTIQERESTLPYFDITTISPRRSMTLMALGLDSGLSVT